MVACAKRGLVVKVAADFAAEAERRNKDNDNDNGNRQESQIVDEATHMALLRLRILDGVVYWFMLRVAIFWWLRVRSLTCAFFLWYVALL